MCLAGWAIRADPENVAYWADYPTFHQDLTARRYWLIEWRDANAERLSLDMDFFCPKAAGVWIWCLSNWIGGSGDMLSARTEKRPKVYDTMGGVGVQVQVLKKNLRPYTEDSGGRGVQVQRKKLESHQIPFVGGGAQGVQAQSRPFEGKVGDGSRLSAWMFALAERLARVVVLNREWTSAVTPIMLRQSPTSPKPPAGVFLDPPYSLENGRKPGIYANDTEAINPARAAYEWAIEYGREYRIGYCCLEGDFPVPDGWTALYRTLGGTRTEERRRVLDCVLFSPACKAAKYSAQPKLL